MAGRIVVFGATGYTGRLVAERLAGAGERPVLAGRSPERLEALAADLGGLETAHGDVMRSNSVFALVGEGDVLVSTVGPFMKWGEPAVRAAIAGRAAYLDSTGEPPFIRRVFEQHGPAAQRAGVPLMTAMGYDWVPGALAGGLALEEGGEEAVRVDVGYYALGAGGAAASLGTRRSMVGASLGDSYAFRDGALRSVRTAERVREFPVKGKARAAISIGGAEHFGLPAAFARLREVNVYLGWFGALARPMQAGTLVGSVATKVPGVREALEFAGTRLADLGGAGPEPGTTPGGLSWIAAQAYDAGGRQVAEVHLSGVDGYAFTAEFLAWAARATAGGRVRGVGAIGPVEAFGLEELERGCAVAGLSRTGA
ncbi:MAG TPA: saccharopine dehydrogenase NADP-binding domain-containing protein [Solirubrobacteraceae bacterium]|nr:saccharopine dehydrogenase NADP-binding domain-containing protein [Solirubrobacteraceae bacterium]